MLTMMVRPGIFRHASCRNCVYPRSGIHRYLVPEGFVLWEESMSHYSPPFHTSPEILGRPWADIDINPGDEHPKWNQIDGNINRVSHHGDYEILSEYPMNPIGRTGLWGRGVLGRWGPNHCVDTIVTRWKRDEQNKLLIDKRSNKPILQMIAIQRMDNMMWSIPSRIREVGPSYVQTFKMAFLSDAIYCGGGGADSANEDDDREIEPESVRADLEIIENFFAHGTEIYKGYVDDYRNTDNSWIETITHLYHDERGTIVNRLNFSGEPDVNEVKWLDISCGMVLHGNHSDIIEQVVGRFSGHW